MRLLSALLMCFMTACGQEASRGISSVVLVTIDGLAHERHGGREALEEWAEDALGFPSVSAASNWVVPSVASVLTGKNAVDHGLSDLEGGFCDQDLISLAEVLTGAGWVCHALVADEFLDNPRGLDQGFASWESPGGEALGGTEAVLKRGTALLASSRGPVFLWIHLGGPRPPYSAPKNWNTERQLQPGQDLERLLRLTRGVDPAPLDDLVELHLHEQRLHLGALSTWLDGIGPRTLVAVAGTCGFELGEQGRIGTGTSMGQEALAVPLFLRGPGVAVGRIQRRVGHVDLMPTLLDLCGQAWPPGLSGISILPGRSAPWRPLFSSTRRAHRRDVVFEESLKLLRDGESGELTLYDLGRDPSERMDHGTRLGSDRTRLRKVLHDHLGLP